LEQGCLWVDTRYNFEHPLALELQVPSRSLDVPPGARWLFEAMEGAEKFQSLTGSAEAGAGFCPGLVAAAFQPLGVLVLADEYDQKTRHRPPFQVLGPALVDVLQGIPGLVLTKGSGSASLARRVASAFRNGGEGLARRVGRETGARWVLIASASGSPRRLSDRGRKKEWVQAHAAYRLMDVATGELLTEDACNTRVAVGPAGRLAAEKRSFQAASVRLGGYLAENLPGLLAGESHSRNILSLTFSGVDADSGSRIKEALARLDSVKRLEQERFGQGRLKLSLQFRGPKERFLAALRLLEVPGLKLSASPGTGDELQMAVEPGR
jgi:hypothetical protein